MGRTLNMITFWQSIVQADPSGSNISSCPLRAWTFYEHVILFCCHNRNFYGDTDYMESRVNFPRN